MATPLADAEAKTPRTELREEQAVLGRPESPIARLRRAIFRFSHGVALTVAALAPLPFGSVELGWIALWCLLLGLSLTLASIGEIDATTRRTLIAVLLVFAVFGATVALQLSDAVAPDPIWSEATRLLGRELKPIASASAWAPVIAMGAPLLFVLAFCRFALLGGSSQSAELTLRVVAWSGLIYVVYSSLALLIDPTALLWRDKPAYLGNLTGTFINRNTAATYFGSVAIIWFMRLASAARRGSSSRLSPSERLWLLLSGRDLHLARLGAAFLISLGGVAATGSRAGFVFTIICLAIAAAIYGRVDFSLWRRRFWSWLAAAIAIFALFELLGGVVASRVFLLGLNDEGRFNVYAASIGLIRDHPWLGVGLGNFDVVFPAVRPPDILISGVWDRAHSTPLEFVIEMGLPLTALVGGLWLLILARLARASLRTRSSTMIAGFAATLLGCLHSSVDFSLQIPGYAVAFAAIAGTATAQAGRLLRDARE
ncbi:O-antigen ligase family protein [Terrarubrum flagellatum]|uniref:O-antigen ligase family protein n=1 Tax=Terrirubrum flagellatum TaxID=2895980 RepID=UPI0031451118